MACFKNMLYSHQDQVVPNCESFYEISSLAVFAHITIGIPASGSLDKFEAWKKGRQWMCAFWSFSMLLLTCFENTSFLSVSVCSQSAPSIWHGHSVSSLGIRGWESLLLWTWQPWGKASPLSCLCSAWCRPAILFTQPPVFLACLSVCAAGQLQDHEVCGFVLWMWVNDSVLIIHNDTT